MIGYDYCHERAVRRISLLNRKKHGEFLSRLFSSLIRIIYPCDIDCHAIIGENVRIPHATGIVIGYSAIIEDDVLIMSGVVIGSRFDHNGDRGHATIKKGAMLGANCVILGRITVGEGAKIGAGAVITKDVPAHATVVGNNKIIKTS